MASVTDIVKLAVSTAVKNAANTAGSGSSGGSGSSKSLGYDPNKDYSKELQRTDLSAAERQQLETERQAKINDKYGGVEPVMTGSDKTYSQVYGGSSGSGNSKTGQYSVGDSVPLSKGAGYVTGGYTIGVNGSPILDENPYWSKSLTETDFSRRPDLAGQTATTQNGRTVWYDADGYAHTSKPGGTDYLPKQDFYVQNGTYKGGNLWTDEEMMTAADLAKVEQIRAQLNAGQLTADQANQLANQIRSGYGYTIDKAGNVYDSGVGASVAARRSQYGLTANTLTDAEQRYLELMFPEQETNDPETLLGSLYALNQGTYKPPGQSGSSELQYPELGGYGGSGYSSFEEFLADTGYDQYAEATQAAIRAAVQNAVNGYRDQIDTTNEDSDELARQAYIAKMLGQKNLDQKLSANGYAGGMADSQRIATETDYQNQLTDIEKQRLATIKELESAITNAQLTGDMQTAQELASYLQQLQGQWVNYVQNQQQMAQQNYWNQMQLENDNYWNQQSLNAQNQESAYTRALTLLNAGFMPNDETLAAAGISRSEAKSMANLVKSQLGLGAAAAGGSTSSPTGVSKTSGSVVTKSQSNVNQGMERDEQIAKAAAQYRERYPNIALDSRTLDNWLADNGFSGEDAQLFKAYLEQYGAVYSRR